MGRGEEKLTARSLFRKMIKSDYTVLRPLYPLPFQPPSPPKWGGKKSTHLLNVQNLASKKFAISDVIIKKKSQLTREAGSAFFF